MRLAILAAILLTVRGIDVLAQAPATTAQPHLADAGQGQIERIGQIRNGRLRRREASRALIRAASDGDIGLARQLVRRFRGILMMPEWPDVSARASQQAQANGHPELATFLAELDRRREAILASGAPPPPPDDDGPGEPPQDEGPEGPTPRDFASQPAAAAPKAVVSDVDTPKYHENERPNDFALIVGVQKYENLPDASYAERDADAIHKHLLALGVPERNIIVLEGDKATRGKLQGYLEEWLPKNVGKDSDLIFYFSGHGAPDPKTGDAYLVPWDGDAKFLQSTAYPLKRLYDDLSKTGAKHTLVALDSCFSGAGGRSVLAPGARPLVTQVSAVRAPDGLTILAAASGDEITGTLDDQGHGLFTYYLLKGLNGGQRSAKSLYKFLKPRVEDEAHRENREQTPTFAGGDSAL